MRKTAPVKPVGGHARKKRPVHRKPKAKVFDAWHLYGSVPGMADWARDQLKKMRDEW